MPTFEPPTDLPSDLIGVALRTFIVYTVLIVAIRVAGKREIGQMSPFDLVLLLIVSNGVQNAMVGTNTSIWGGLVTVIVLFGADRALRRAREIPAVRRLLEGEPVVLVDHGDVNGGVLRREGVDQEDIDHALRAHGYDDIRDVDKLVLEVDGTISVIDGGTRMTTQRRIRRRRRPNLPLS